MDGVCVCVHVHGKSAQIYVKVQLSKLYLSSASLMNNMFKCKLHINITSDYYFYLLLELWQLASLCGGS